MSANAALSPRVTAQPRPTKHVELSVITTRRPALGGMWVRIIALGLIILMIVVPLTISTIQARNALAMGDLRTELKVLQEQNQALTEKLNELSAVEALAERATEQGLVPSTSIGYINLDKNIVIGGSRAE